MLEEGKSATAVGKALELSRNMVSRWGKEYQTHGDKAFTGHGQSIKDQEFEIGKLQKELSNWNKSEIS